MKAAVTSTKPEPISTRKPLIRGWEKPDAQNDDYQSVFLDMRRQWSESYANYIAREKAWKVTALLAIGVALVCAGGMAYLGAQNKMIPYVVAVNQLGDALPVHRADVAGKPDTRIIRAQLARWIENVRSLYQDAGAERANFTSAYSMIRKNDAAYNTLNAYFTENDPFKRAASVGASVEISTVLPISEDTWQVQWMEKVHSTKGELISATPMQANLTIALDPPTEESALLKNPMGVYITNYHWSPRL
jgi:type IV secretory pathway TrbF-like protein